MTIVSACLVGCKCRYDGAACTDETLRARWDRGELVPLCPEQLGGLATPRPAAEIESGSGEDVLDGRARVLRGDGADVTGAFIEGAKRTLEVARALGAHEAILKQGSPSCGCGRIARRGHPVACNGACAGNGVTSALLAREGIHVIAHE